MAASISSTMLKKITGFLVRRKNGDISPAEAEKIQKASYALIHAEVKKKYTPVYQGILNGLDSEEKQIFEATIYYLVRIAQNKPKYHDEILEILKEKSKNSRLSPEFREIIKINLQTIKSKNNQ